VHVRVVEATDPAAAISRATRDEKVDFIAMSTRGSSGLKRLVLGSVAEKVVRDSVVPVLLVTPR
jgi:nucleotide-binding universal stress UspA family protein